VERLRMGQVAMFVCPDDPFLRAAGAAPLAEGLAIWLSLAFVRDGTEVPLHRPGPGTGVLCGREPRDAKAAGGLRCALLRDSGQDGPPDRCTPCEDRGPGAYALGRAMIGWDLARGGLAENFPIFELLEDREGEDA